MVGKIIFLHLTCKHIPKFKRRNLEISERKLTLKTDNTSTKKGCQKLPTTFFISQKKFTFPALSTPEHLPQQWQHRQVLTAKAIL